MSIPSRMKRMNTPGSLLPRRAARRPFPSGHYKSVKLCSGPIVQNDELRPRPQTLPVAVRMSMFLSTVERGSCMIMELKLSILPSRTKGIAQESRKHAPRW